MCLGSRNAKVPTLRNARGMTEVLDQPGLLLWTLGLCTGSILVYYFGFWETDCGLQLGGFGDGWLAACLSDTVPGPAQQAEIAVGAVGGRPLLLDAPSLSFALSSLPQDLLP